MEEWSPESEVDPAKVAERLATAAEKSLEADQARAELAARFVPERLHPGRHAYDTAYYKAWEMAIIACADNGEPLSSLSDKAAAEIARVAELAAACYDPPQFESDWGDAITRDLENDKAVE